MSTLTLDRVRTHSQATAEQLCQRSAERLSRSEFDLALLYAQRALFADPSLAIAHQRRGEALEGLGKISDAHKAYLTGLQHSPNNAELKKSCEEVVKLATALNALEDLPGDDRQSSSMKFAALIEWLKAGGAKFPKLAIKELEPGYRSVHATEEIAANELVLSIPRHFIMYTELAMQSKICQSFTQKVHSRHSYLAAFILQEKNNEGSFWKPYLDVFPQSFDSIPINFTAEELSYLKGSISVAKINQRRESLRVDYETIVDSAPEFRMFSFEEFCWARCVVITRIFGVSIDGIKTEALVPLADFINHKLPRESTWTFHVPTDSFTVTSIGTIPEYAQISDSYGRKCNSRFFVNYGFVLEENEDNEALVRLEISEDDDLFEQKAGILKNETHFETNVRAMIGDYRLDECLSFLRFANMNARELCQCTSGNSHFSAKRVEPLNAGNEHAALGVLKMAVLESLDKFETSVLEDEQLLLDSRLSTNVRNAILMRRCEKKVLHFLLEFVAEVQPLLSLPFEELRWVFNKCKRRQTGRFDQYILRVVRPLVRERSLRIEKRGIKEGAGASIIPGDLAG